MMCRIVDYINSVNFWKTVVNMEKYVYIWLRGI